MFPPAVPVVDLDLPSSVVAQKYAFMDSHVRHNRPFVLLTGGTGLVGGLVLARLLELEIPVAVLVRGNRRQSAAERVETLMQQLEERFGRLFIRPVVLNGDLCQRGLGLADFHRRWVALKCGSVIHSAANLLFRPASEHPRNEPYLTNVDGTRHLLEVMSATQIHEWHYVSTAYIAGLRNGLVQEREANVGQQFGNDYERSKVRAEEMLRASAAMASLTIYRPSIVIDLHPTTRMRSDQTINSAFMMFQTLSRQFGLPERGEWFRRLGFGGEERKNIVTVDWVAAMITGIYRRPALHGSTYHLTSPNGTAASNLEDAFRAAVQVSGLKLPPRRTEAMAMIDEHAAPFVAAFKPYFKDDPRFDRANTKRAMEVCCESDVPDLTVEQLRDFCMRQAKSASPVASVADPAVRPAWSLTIEQMEQSCRELAPDVCSRRESVRVDVLGVDGKSLCISDSANGLALQSPATLLTDVRWITTADTMSEFIGNRLAVREAMETGRLLLEVDSADDPAISDPGKLQTETLIRQFEQIIAGMRRFAPDSPSRRSEVAYVR